MSSSSVSAAADAGRMQAQSAQQSGVGAAASGKRADRQSVLRQQLNVHILEASSHVAIKAGNESQALLLRSAIDHINEFLAPEFGPTALQAKMGEDNSPEAVAERILSMATGFFDAYAAQRPNQDADKIANDFVQLVRGGFERGFNEAKDILQSLQVLGGEIESGIMKTFERVHKGFDDFLAGKLQGSVG